MSANELFKAGQLAQAIDAQIQAVKSKPADHGLRIFLFELLCFAGELDRAQKQIDVVKYDQAELDAAVLGYRRLLDSERARRKVFQEKAQPMFLGPIPESINQRLLALTQLVEGKTAEAGALLDQLNGEIVPVKGKLNDKAFEGFRDGDDRLAGVLEVMAHGNYFWVPIEQISMIAANAPKFPRDLLWLPAHLELKEGQSGSVFLPSLYPESYAAKDPQLQLGRLTDWQGESPVIGSGLKNFFAGEEVSAVPDWRKIEFDE